MAKDKTDDYYYLYDGTKVSRERVLLIAYRYQGTYKGLGAIMVAIVLIMTLGLIRDYKTLDLALVITLLTIDVFISILSVLFFSMNKRMDLIKFGLSILNYRRKQMINQELNQDEYNTILADTVINLNMRPRQVIFIHTKNQIWQYRIGKYLSMPLLINDVINVEITTLRKNFHHIIISSIDQSGVIFHCTEYEKAKSIQQLLKHEDVLIN